MFLAMPDARAVLIKLADRLHNMMTLDALSMLKQQRFAKETLEIFAPLANRLGISSWKEQLENLCFKSLYPDKHKEISSKLSNSFDEALINSSAEKLERALGDAAISYRGVSKRHKSLYSIFRKMEKYSLSLSDSYHFLQMRIHMSRCSSSSVKVTVVHITVPQLPSLFIHFMPSAKSLMDSSILIW